MPVQYQDFRPFNLGEVYRTVEAVKGARLNNQRRQQDIDEGNRKAQYDELLIQTGRQAVDPQTGRYSAAAHARALDAAGYPAAGAALRENALGYLTKAQQYVSHAVRTVNPQNYQAVIGDLVQQRIIPEGFAPAQYDPAWVQRAHGAFEQDLAEQYSELQPVAQGPGGAVIYGQRESRSGKLANVTTVKPERPRQEAAPKPFKFSATDSNTIYRQAAGAFGGLYDPITGRIGGLNPDQAQQVQAVAARASQRYRASQGELDHASAVEEALAEMRGGRSEAATPAAAPQAGSQPVRVSTPEEAMRLPSGTVFITPDGRRKVR